MSPAEIERMAQKCESLDLVNTELRRALELSDANAKAARIVAKDLEGKLKQLTESTESLAGHNERLHATLNMARQRAAYWRQRCIEEMDGSSYHGTVMGSPL